MLEKVIFDLVACALFVIILFKVIGKNDSNYICILILQAIGILISFIEMKFKIKCNIILICIRYIFSIITPLIIMFLELNGINFSEILSCSIAKIYIALGNDKKAKNILIKLVTKYPDSYLGHKLLAEIYEKEGGMRKAIDEYVKLVDIKRDDDKSYFKIANLLNDLGQKDEAIQMLENLVKVKPDAYDGSILLGELLCDSERFKEAESVYQNALKYKPNDYDLYFNLGHVYTMLSEFQMAKEAYEMAAEINHLAYSANYNLGEIYIILGELDTAKMYFEKSLYDDLEPISYYNLAKIFAMKDENSNAVNFLNKAIELQPPLLQKANKDKCFASIRHLITVSVKMDDDNTLENNKKDDNFKKKRNYKLEKKAREYLESTNSLVRDMSENNEKQIIKEKVDKIFQKAEEEKNIEIDEKTQRQKE